MPSQLVYHDISHNRIVVRAPRGYWKMDAAQAALADFSRLLGNKSVHFVGDCRYLEGYDREVRDAWQKLLLLHREQILSYTFVGVQSGFVRLGVAIMSVFVKKTMIQVQTLEGLH